MVTFNVVAVNSGRNVGRLEPYFDREGFINPIIDIGTGDGSALTGQDALDLTNRIFGGKGLDGVLAVPATRVPPGLAASDRIWPMDGDNQPVWSPLDAEEYWFLADDVAVPPDLIAARARQRAAAKSRWRILFGLDADATVTDDDLLALDLIEQVTGRPGRTEATEHRLRRLHDEIEKNTLSGTIDRSAFTSLAEVRRRVREVVELAALLRPLRPVQPLLHLRQTTDLRILQTVRRLVDVIRRIGYQGPIGLEQVDGVVRLLRWPGQVGPVRQAERQALLDLMATVKQL